MNNDNMKLWNDVCTTDPAITKRVNKRGGFTAIDAQAQIKRATELWGPYGWKWGVRSLRYSYLTEGEGKKIVEAALKGDFFYPIGDKDEAVLEIATDISYRAGNDSCKKLLTDLTTKALSKLGFNSDVFEGKFDDNKYVEKLKNGNGKKITDDQLDTIDKLVKETETDGKKFMEYVSNTFKEKELGNVSYIAGQSLIANLNTKLDKQNAKDN